MHTDTPHDAGFIRQIVALREAKDHFFAHSHHSPVPPARQYDFAGLAYYPPDASYRIAGLRLEPADRADTAPFAIATSDNRPRTAFRLGRLRFELAGQRLVLTAYQIGDDGAESLFVPFRDATSGRETYGAGRYLDLASERDGTYVLDFNQAYNPYCAYSDTYSCPLPPAENRLPVPIEAGERLGRIYRSDTRE